MTDTLREAVERRVQQIRDTAIRVKPTDVFVFQAGLPISAADLEVVAPVDLEWLCRAILADHPAPAPEPSRCTCGLPGCSDEPDTAGDDQPTPGALERITLCRRSPVRDRWECITWPDKPTAYPCVHDHSHCDYIGCVEHVDGMHVDKAGDAIVHVSCDRCVDPPNLRRHDEMWRDRLRSLLQEGQ